MAGMFSGRSLRTPRLATISDSNGSDPAASLNFAPNLLEAFIPGYSIISRFILQSFGFDIGLIVSTGFLLVTFATATRFLWSRLRQLVLEYFVATVTVTDQDGMFEHCLSWSAKQRVGMTARTIQAVSRTNASSQEDELEVVNDDDNNQSGSGAVIGAQLFHTRRMAKVPPRYEPYFGSYYFWRGWRLFVFERQRTVRQQTTWARKAEEEHVNFKTLGWRTEPLKKLLEDIKDWSIQQENVFTVIKRPAPKDRSRGGAWVVAMERPSRPMETVVLDPREQASLIADVNDYLLPSTRRWYARRGMPYRRGYLFHGPPGTGKSSLSFALAGVFGLEVYLISLRDQTMTESDLQSYFNSLPRRCVVLLEDIDTAGLEKRSLPAAKKSAVASRKARNTELKLAGAPLSALEPEDTSPNTGISLSGLLNAIDGVASHEGRVLVMTTNRPEMLDEALIRPGRVDYQVKFTLATKHQMREIFIRMYFHEETSIQGVSNRNLKSSTTTKSSNGAINDSGSGSSNGLAKRSANGSISKGNGYSSPSSTDSKTHKRDSSIESLQQSTKDLLQEILQTPRAEYSRAELETLGDDFCQLIPEYEFSPAEIQNFLIPRRKDPRKAVREAETWFKNLLEQKRAKEAEEADAVKTLKAVDSRDLSASDDIVKS